MSGFPYRGYRGNSRGGYGERDGEFRGPRGESGFGQRGRGGGFGGRGRGARFRGSDDGYGGGRTEGWRDGGGMMQRNIHNGGAPTEFTIGFRK